MLLICIRKMSNSREKISLDDQSISRRLGPIISKPGLNYFWGSVLLMDQGTFKDFKPILPYPLYLIVSPFKKFLAKLSKQTL